MQNEAMSDIANRVAAIRERISAAAQRAGRDPSEITLVVVTKTQPIARIEQAIAAGIVHLGENRVQEALPKIAALQHARPTWHLIGHLQRNKARNAALFFDTIHALDSLRLAELLNRARAESTPAERRPLPVLLQINISGEAQKEGFALTGGREDQQHWPALLVDIAQIAALPYLRIEGLMTIAPFTSDPQTTRPVFRSLRHLRDRLARHFPGIAWQHLSMGMTNDFEIAIEEGATLVRIGRAIFGERTS